MAENSKIQWTEATWNCLAGCTEISPGCLNCYAAVMAHRLAAMGHRKYHGTTRKLPNGKVVWTGVVNLDEAALTIPLKRKKPTVYFVNSMSDLFHESVPFEFVDKMFAVMNACNHTLPASENSRHWHTFQVLTKRADRMRQYMESRLPQNFRQGEHPWFKAGRGEGGALRGMGGDIMNAGAIFSWPPSNVWLGVSAEDQQRANERIPHLLQCPAAIRFVSYEPALGPVEFDKLQTPQARDGLCYSALGSNDQRFHESDAHIDWLIVGGESGHGARPFDVQWARDAIRQCNDASVACFVKQLGSNAEDWDSSRHPGKGPFISNTIRDKKGGDPAEWAPDLRVRQFPKLATHIHGAMKNEDTIHT